METPQLGQEFPEAWQTFLVECTECMQPLGWASYKSDSGKIMFVQVAYSLYGHRQICIIVLPRKYRGNIGKEVEISKLFKFAAAQHPAELPVHHTKLHNVDK